MIRVLHGDLDESWWKRAMAQGEKDAQKIEAIIRDATGLKRVYRQHRRQCVDFRLNSRLFDRAAIAVRLEYPDAIEPSLAILR